MPHVKGHVAAPAQTGGCPFVPTSWSRFPAQIQQHGDFLYLTTSKSTDMSPASGRIDLDAQQGKSVEFDYKSVVQDIQGGVFTKTWWLCEVTNLKFG